MTVLEMIPLMIAMVVAIVSATLLSTRGGVPANWSFIIGGILGVASWVFYGLLLRKSGVWAQRMQAKKDKRELDRRTYHSLGLVTEYPVAKNVFYECMTCGNAIQSKPKKNVSCKCGNIGIDVGSGRRIIKQPEKIKVFHIGK